MINQKQKELSINAQNAITEALETRIPCIRELRGDDNPQYVMQSDLFGNVDTVIQLGGSERFYLNQNKSRADGKKDICIECRSFRGQPVNLKTNQKAPIAGAYWYETGQRWLTPRWGQIDTFSVYLSGPKFVGHYLRYYLEILFSKRETWLNATGIFRLNDDCDTYIVFFDCEEFTHMYMETVAEVTCGNDLTIISISNSELDAIRNDMDNDSLFLQNNQPTQNAN